jgi:hypothetical protein
MRIQRGRAARARHRPRRSAQHRQAPRSGAPGSGERTGRPDGPGVSGKDAPAVSWGGCRPRLKEPPTLSCPMGCASSYCLRPVSFGRSSAGKSWSHAMPWAGSRCTGRTRIGAGETHVLRPSRSPTGRPKSDGGHSSTGRTLPSVSGSRRLAPAGCLVLGTSLSLLEGL